VESLLTQRGLLDISGDALFDKTEDADPFLLQFAYISEKDSNFLGRKLFREEAQVEIILQHRLQSLVG